MQQTKENKRSWRFSTGLKGLYFTDEKKAEGKECTIINISLNGAGLEFYALETINVNSKLFLEIRLPNEKEKVNVEGIIRWVKQGGKSCVCGIQLTEKLDKETRAMLRI
jgi:hypothetical protein